MLANTSSSRPARYENQHTFFGETKTAICKNGFVRNVEGSMRFGTVGTIQKSVSEQWNTVK